MKEILNGLADQLRAAFPPPIVVSNPIMILPDYHVCVSGFNDSVQIMVKVQHTGQTVVANLVPMNGTKPARDSFKAATEGRRDLLAMRGGGRYRNYIPLRNYVNAGPFYRGISIDDNHCIVAVVREAVESFLPN